MGWEGGVMGGAKPRGRPGRGTGGGLGRAGGDAGFGAGAGVVRFSVGTRPRVLLQGRISSLQLAIAPPPVLLHFAL